MYTESPIPARVLIVKTSSLGDIIQAFVVLDDLKKRLPEVLIDWVVEAPYTSIVSAHPLVSRVISLEKRDLWGGIRRLRKQKYDFVFDLQGNCKSGLVTFFSRGKVKVGYGFSSVREWPNVLTTHKRFNVSKEQNIRLFYLELIERYFKKKVFEHKSDGVQFFIEEDEKIKIRTIVQNSAKMLRIMICPGSKWINKQLDQRTLVSFLQKIEEVYEVAFFLVWGGETEKIQCHEIKANLKEAIVIEKLLLPTWQNLMNEMDLVIAVDSSALHLCATGSTPSFSIFGPTSAAIFKPIGERHVVFQGSCPYGRRFVKQCPILRSCQTGACIREIKAEELFQAFQNQRAFLRLQ